MIGYYRYEGYPLEQKIAWIKQGQGPGALTGAQEALAGLAEALVESEQRLRDLVTKLGGSWNGAAADAAGASVRKAMTWSGDTGVLTSDALSSVDLQAELVARTRSLTPDSAPAAEYGFDDALADSFNRTSGGLFDVQTNFDEQAARRKAVEEEVNRVLYAHEAASRTNLAAVPALTEVPRVTADSQPPATNCLPVAPVQPADQQPPTVAKTGDKRDTDRKDREENRKDDQKQNKDDDGRKTEQDEDDKPGQVEPQRERTTAAAVATSPPELKQPVQDHQGQQQQQNTRPSGSVHNGLPAPVGRIGTPVTDTSRPGVVPRTTTPTAVPTGRTGGSATSRAGIGRSGIGGGTNGVAATAGKGREPAVAPGNRAGVQQGTPQSPVRGGMAPGQGRPGGFLPGAAGYGSQGAAQREEDAEHTNRYYEQNDGLFDLGDMRGIAPAVLGEEPE